MLEEAAGHGSVEQNHKSGQGSQGTVVAEKKKKKKKKKKTIVKQFSTHATNSKVKLGIYTRQRSVVTVQPI
jgi:hypothetical protein